MIMPRPILRNALASDLPGIVAVENLSWPVALAATAEQAAARIAAYPHGQWVAEVECRIVAVVWSQRITESFLASHAASYDQLTDGGRFTKSHDPRGEIFQLIGVGVSPEARGLRLGRMLVDREIEIARSLTNVRRIIGFTRPVGYHQHVGMALSNYIAMRDNEGKHVDPMLAFHVEAGAKIVSLHSDFRPEDIEAGGNGVLIEYPLTPHTGKNA
jgi:GNAT superfamily N-acetyltransferase